MGLHKVEGSPYWHYSFKLAGRSRQRGSTGYEDRKLAQAKYHKLRSEAQQNVDFQKPTKITVGELLEWANKNHWQYGRLEWQIQSVARQFGNVVAARITLQDLLDYRSRRLEQVEPPTVNRELTLLRAAYNYAIDCGMLAINPVAKLKTLDCSDRQRVKFLRPEEKVTLLNGTTGLLQDLILFALKTGMRKGEIRGLKWADVDPNRNQMRVISYKGGKAIVRYVPIFNQTQEIIDRQNHATEFVFTDELGAGLGSYSCMNSSFYRIVKALNIQSGDFHFHDLRHTFASDYLMMGGTISALQDILGHRRADTTRRYAHLSKEHLKVEMDRLPYEKYEQNLAGECHNSVTSAVSSDGRVLP